MTSKGKNFSDGSGEERKDSVSVKSSLRTKPRSQDNVSYHGSASDSKTEPEKKSAQSPTLSQKISEEKDTVKSQSLAGKAYGLVNAVENTFFSPVAALPLAFGKVGLGIAKKAVEKAARYAEPYVPQAVKNFSTNVQSRYFHADGAVKKDAEQLFNSTIEILTGVFAKASTYERLAQDSMVFQVLTMKTAFDVLKQTTTAIIPFLKVLKYTYELSEHAATNLISDTGRSLLKIFSKDKVFLNLFEDPQKYQEIIKGYTFDQYFKRAVRSVVLLCLTYHLAATYGGPASGAFPSSFNELVTILGQFYNTITAPISTIMASTNKPAALYEAVLSGSRGTLGAFKDGFLELETALHNAVESMKESFWGKKEQEVLDDVKAVDKTSVEAVKPEDINDAKNDLKETQTTKAEKSSEKESNAEKEKNTTKETLQEAQESLEKNPSSENETMNPKQKVQDKKSQETQAKQENLDKTKEVLKQNIEQVKQKAEESKNKIQDEQKKEKDRSKTVEKSSQEIKNGKKAIEEKGNNLKLPIMNTQNMTSAEIIKGVRNYTSKYLHQTKDGVKFFESMEKAFPGVTGTQLQKIIKNYLQEQSEVAKAISKIDFLEPYKWSYPPLNPIKVLEERFSSSIDPHNLIKDGIINNAKKVLSEIETYYTDPTSRLPSAANKRNIRFDYLIEYANSMIQKMKERGYETGDLVSKMREVTNMAEVIKKS
ncbi:Chromosome partition protein Smc [Holospora curviuscula]|uniref:Chromosome partition protein Smc n=1 Tax=Holospora curviuscula TaxID=1082868 RepID=A0A2S5R8R3_9PROT|nr:Chromosome partition protein Smc [Holospora curviuscula]